MEYILDKKVENFLKIIAKTARAQNVRVFFVGGIVRDNYLNKKIEDIDLIIEGNAIEFSEHLPSEIVVKSFHRTFGTVKVEYFDVDCDIASTREEIYEYSGSLPNVVNIGVKIEKDYLRRDFSINSMYSEILIENDVLKFNLFDFANGVEDINQKTLKVLHKNSYIDDPTRIIRGLGFKYRFGFDFSAEDKTLIKNYLSSVNLENASYDRILAVFKKTLQNKYQDEIFKEILKEKYYALLNQEIIEADFEWIKKVFDCFSLNIQEKAEFYIKILTNQESLKIDFSSKTEEYKFYSKLSNIEKAFEYFKTANKNILLFENIKLETTGADLIALNCPQGRIIGDMLDNLLLEKINNPQNFKSKNDEILWLKSVFPNF